jgi:hypothetical protein
MADLDSKALFPRPPPAGIVFLIFFSLNMFIWGQKSSGAVPFGTFFALLVMWFGISVPLVYFGSYIGYRMPKIGFPTKPNVIPRTVPEQVRRGLAMCGRQAAGSLSSDHARPPAQRA